MAEQMTEFVTTCEDFGCENGMTIQGRKYHPDGRVDEQWAPCGHIADTCRNRADNHEEASDGNA